MKTSKSRTDHSHSSTPLTIAVDALGGDGGIEIATRGSLLFLNSHPTVNIILVGSEPQIEAILKSQKCPAWVRGRLTVLHCDDRIDENARFSQCLRDDRPSSMYKTLELVARRLASGCLSSGNSGALMGLAVKTLGMQEGISRPAICARIPLQQNCCYLLDCGALVNVTPARLLEFARLGAEFVTANHGIYAPRIALLNIGSEDNKGTPQIQDTHQLMKDSGLNYQGFFEASELYSTRTEVIVCDGLIGNTVLKSCEGTASHILQFIRGHRWLQFAVKLMFRRLMALLDVRNHNGALLLGVNGVVGVSHGRADAVAFSNALSVVKTHCRPVQLQELR